MKSTAESKFRWLLLGGVFLTSSVFASFEPLPVGARAAGMGEAYTAIVDDVYALYYNPAGLLQLNRPELGAYYSQLFVGLTDNSEINRTFLGYGQPFGENGKWGSIGVSYLALELSGLYKEEAIGISYGHEYKRLWNLGGTLKLLRKKIGSDPFTNNAINPISGSATGSADPLLAAESSADAFALDLGAQYRLTRAYAVGLALRNINGPDLALGSEKDRAPAVVAASIARRLRQGSLGVEVTNWKSAESNLRLGLGGERWFDNGFALRAGGGFGSNDYTNISAGASYKMQSFQIDYAASLPLQGVEDTFGFQQVSLTVRFGKPPVDPLEQQLIHEKEQRIRAETEARYAKAERDRLKKQLIELTKAKSEAQREKERLAAEQALQEAEEQARRKAQSTTRQGNRSREQQAFSAYTKDLADYNSQVRRGIGLREKKSILERILNKFKDTGIDTSTVDRELQSIRVEQNQANKDFELSMNFYRRLVEQGASISERKSMLDRIIQKYQNSGIDIKSALNEKKALQ